MGVLPCFFTLVEVVEQLTSCFSKQITKPNLTFQNERRFLLWDNYILWACLQGRKCPVDSHSQAILEASFLKTSKPNRHEDGSERKGSKVSGCGSGCDYEKWRPRSLGGWSQPPVSCSPKQPPINVSVCSHTTHTFPQITQISFQTDGAMVQDG